MNRSLFGCLVLVLGLASPLLGQEVVRESRVFDIEFLTRVPEDFPGPELAIRSGAEEAMPPMMDFVTGEAQMEPELLIQMIKANVDPDSWNNVMNKIRAESGKLLVTQTGSNLDRIAALLGDLRSRVGDFVEVEGFVLAVKVAYLEGLLSILETRKKGATLGEKAVKALLGRSVKEGFVRVLDSASVLAFSGQRVHSASLKGRTIVRDVDVEVAQMKETEDPVIGVVEEGFVLDVRPTVGDGDAGILLDLKLAYQDLQDPMPSVQTQLARIDLPAARHFSLQTTLVVPDGGAILFSGAHVQDGDEAFAFLVRARKKGLVTKKPKKATGSKARRILKAYNVKILTADIEDHPAGDNALGMLRGGDDGGAAPPMFEEDSSPEGVALTGEDLVHLVCSNIEEDSWANERNSIDFTAGVLVVLQTKEVHGKIEAFLKNLRARRVVLTQSTARYIEVDDALLTDLFPDGPAWGHTHLAPASREALLEAARTGKRAKLLSLSSHVAFNRQRTHIARRNVYAYIGDFDVEVAQDAAIHDPIIRTLSDGVLMDLKCTLTGDGKHVTLELRPGLASTTWPFQERKIKTEQGERIVHLPDVALETVRTSVTIPDGSTVMFLGGRSLTKPGRRMVLLISVNLIRLGK